jgi:hypothetical protein
MNNSDLVSIIAIVALASIAVVLVVFGKADHLLVSGVVGAIVFIATREYYRFKLGQCLRIMGDGHEYRFSYALFFLMGFFAGTLDASILDFTAKFFIAIGSIYILMMWSLYELLAMGKPSNLVLSALILIGGGTLGFVGAWHLSWLATWWPLHGPPPREIWLAPNIYADLYIYTAITGISLAIYLILGLLINFSEKLKNIYRPVKK